MPIIRGDNLRDATEGLGPAKTCELLAEMLHAIAHAHQNDVLHRDLKPNNVLVRTVDMQAVIVDFGSAYLFEHIDKEVLTTATPVGTPGYIPTEVLADPKLRSPQHDIFSCGVTAYEVFARRLPDPAAYQPLGENDPRLASLDEPIRRAIAGVKERYQTAGEFREALLHAAEAL